MNGINIFISECGKKWSHGGIVVSPLDAFCSLIRHLSHCAEQSAEITNVIIIPAYYTIFDTKSVKDFPLNEFNSLFYAIVFF